MGDPSVITTTADEPGKQADVGLPAFAWRPALILAGATAALLIAFAARDGYHRDELYFLEASRHMAWGYVDQPPLSVAMIWLTTHLFGGSLFALRLIPALVDSAVVILGALVCRELGGSRFAQVLTAACVAVSGYLVIGHLAGPTIYDLLFWSLTAALVIRILRTGRPKLWLWVGVVVGLGLEDKETILLLVGGIALGLIVTSRLDWLRSAWLWAGAAIALAFWVPNLVWEVAHHWPVLAMDRSLRAEHSGLGFAIKYPFLQLLALNPFLAPIWIAGVWALWREPRFRPFRSFAVAYAAMFLLLWVMIPDRFYYMAPIYLVMFGAGSIVTEEVVVGARGFLRAKAGRRFVWRSKRAAVAVVSISTLLMVPLSLPVLPPPALATVPLQSINYNLGETIGWPRFVSTVASVWRSLPVSERSTTSIVTGNYGEAGAIDEYRTRFGLPQAFSDHNSFWWWGPPTPASGTTIAAGIDPRFLRLYFGSVRLAVIFENPWGVQDDEEGTPVWLCRDQHEPWPEIWPAFRHYG
jgi:Dolichyl-phosphate-mannose-protein mannosyltransferase